MATLIAAENCPAYPRRPSMCSPQVLIWWNIIPGFSDLTTVASTVVSYGQVGPGGLAKSPLIGFEALNGDPSIGVNPRLVRQDYL